MLSLSSDMKETERAIVFICISQNLKLSVRFLLYFQKAIPVIAIAFSSNRHVEVHQVVGIVGLSLAKIPLDTGASQHHTTKN